MQAIFITIGIYLALGAIGMFFGNQKVDQSTAAKRWLKYFTYLLITATVIAAILLKWFFALAVLIAFTGVYELFQTNEVKKFPAAIFSYLLVASGFIFFAFRFTSNFQFAVYFQVLAFDAFCQITGQLIGKTQIAKRSSPTKTLEGLTGGICFCLLSAILSGALLQISYAQAVSIGLITALSSFTGDILASFYKRIAGIKDYSNLLPGQGGFLDRFDSFMMTGFVYSLLSFFIPMISNYLK